MKKWKVFMGLPSTGTRVDAQTYFLRDIAERYKDTIEFVYPKDCTHRNFHDFARNGTVDEFLETDCDVLWFIDSDVVPAPHTPDLVSIYGDEWEAAGAVYPIWMRPPGGSQTCILFTGYKGLVEDSITKGFRMSEVPRAGTDWLDALATGCLFLKRSVFEKLEKPYFEFKFDKESRRMTEGEDLGFCLKLSKLGIKFFTDYSMVCKHYKNVCLLDINNYATEMSNFRTLEYDKEIRHQVQAAIIAAEEAGYLRGLADQKNRTPKSKSGLILPGSLST